MLRAHVLLPNVRSTDHRIRAMPAVTQINVRRPPLLYLSQSRLCQVRAEWESTLHLTHRGKRELAGFHPAGAWKRVDCVTAPDEGTQWLRRIDDALSSTSGAMLALDRFDEVMRLRRKVRECFESGRLPEARAAAEAAMAILLPRLHG
jgi:hypothetical protein